MKKAFLLLVITTGMLAACNDGGQTAATDEKMTDSTGTMENKMEDKEERNKKIIMASLDAIGSHNVNDVLKDCAPDCTDYGDGSMPAVKGRDSIAKMLQGWMNSFDIKADNMKYVADGDWVWVWGDWSGTFKNDYMGMKATNKSFKYKDVDIFKLSDDGKVLEHHNVQSPNTMMMMVGVQPPKK
jgi:ketosteroid isomerase-like protein